MKAHNRAFLPGDLVCAGLLSLAAFFFTAANQIRKTR